MVVKEGFLIRRYELCKRKTRWQQGRAEEQQDEGDAHQTEPEGYIKTFGLCTQLVPIQ